MIKGLPDYHKDRSAAAEKLSPKSSTSTAETSTTSADKETKSAEETNSSKSGTSTVQKRESSAADFVPDAAAHIVALDISWLVVCYFVERENVPACLPACLHGRRFS